MASTILSGSKSGAWSGNNPVSINQAPKPKRKRASPAKPSTPPNPRFSKWQCPEDFSQFIDSITPKPFTHTLPPRSKMAHGVRVDIKDVLDVYIDLLRALPQTFKKCTSINPVPKTGYIDMGFPTAQDATEAVSIRFTYLNKAIPLQLTRYNKESMTYVNILGLPTTLPGPTIKKKLTERLAKYGEVKNIVFEENKFLPGFIGSKAFVTFGKLNPPPTTNHSAALPCKVYFPDAPKEIVTINVEGQKIRNEKPTVLGDFYLKINPISVETASIMNFQKDLINPQTQNSLDPELLIANDIINDVITEIPDSNPLIPDYTPTISHNDAIDSEINYLAAEMEEYIDPEHNYPKFGRLVANENRYEIYQLRSEVLEVFCVIEQIRSKLTNHFSKHNPPHKPTVSRFTSDLKSNLMAAKDRMDVYWETLQECMAVDEKTDPELIEMMKTYSNYADNPSP